MRRYGKVLGIGTKIQQTQQHKAVATLRRGSTEQARKGQSLDKKTLTFVAAPNNVYVGFDGPSAVALVVPHNTEGSPRNLSWKWSAFSDQHQFFLPHWSFPDSEWGGQQEPTPDSAIRRAAQHIAHGTVRPLDICEDNCPVCPTIIVLDGDPTTRGNGS
jgi:hypothetical protein